MKTTSDLLYSKRLGEMSSNVFIDGECVKARSVENREDLTIEEAKKRNETTLIQEGRKITIYTNKKGSDQYENLIENVEYLKDKKSDIAIVVNH